MLCWINVRQAYITKIYFNWAFKPWLNLVLRGILQDGKWIQNRKYTWWSSPKTDGGCTVCASRSDGLDAAGDIIVRRVASSEVFGWSRSFFVRLRMSSWIIFYITLLNWKFLLKWCNFFWNFCCNRDFLLCTTISIDFWQLNFIPFVLKSRSRKFGKLGVGNFGKSESEILERSELDTIPPTPQPWLYTRQTYQLAIDFTLSFGRNPFPAKNQTLRPYRVYISPARYRHHQLLFK